MEMAEALSVMAGISTVVTSGLLLHRWLRPKFPVKVNCWFCNQSTKVPFGNKNCWDCPACDQYNGFRDDGDYNKPIPAQHEEFFNQTPHVCRENARTVSFTNGFCVECNRNQHLKIVAISNFVPLDEENFDDEVNDYKQYLERVYRLCRGCEAILRQTLGQQDSYLRPQLLNWRIKRSSSRSSAKSSIISNPFIMKINPPKYLPFIRLISLLFITLTTIFEYFEMNDFTNLLTYFIPTCTIDHVIHYFNNFQCDTLLTHLIASIVFAVGVFSNKSTFRTIDAVVLFLLFTSLPLYSSLPIINEIPHLKLTRQILNAMNLFFCFWANFCSRTLPRCQPIRKSSSNFIRTKDISTNAWIQNNFLPNSKIKDKFINPSRPTEVLHNSLGAMSLGTPTKLQKSSGIFTLQDYTSSPSQLSLQKYVLNKSMNDIQQRKPILTPAKFRSPMNHHKNMWECNTYWNPTQQKITSHSWNRGSRSVFNFPSTYVNNFSVSSNGFYSPSCPNSRSGSVCGDDRTSVFSEPPCFRLSPNQQVQDDSLPSSTFDNSTPIQHNGSGDKRGERCSEGTNSSRSSSSTCPVGTTTMNTSESDSCVGYWLKIVLFLSITANLIVMAVATRSYLGF